MKFISELERSRRVQKINHDESKVAGFTLPPAAGDAADAGEFDRSGRAKLRKIFEKYIYGPIPPAPDKLEVILREEDRSALGGIAIRRQLDIVCSMADGRSRVLPMLLYLPRERKNLSCFFGLNFQSNADTTPENAVPLTPRPQLGREATFVMWPWDGKDEKRDSRWCFPEVIRRGFASATIWYGSILPDSPYGIRDSAMQLFVSEKEWFSPKRPFGAVSAWAWGIQRGIDALLTQPEIDPSRIFIHGHSRLGKTALWAGACDPRAAMVISNDSGCCGAALQRRNFGETILQICGTFPHWFLDSFADYAEREAELPFDQHQLLGMIAPRPLAVGSATEDLHADPRGEFLALRAASGVYRMYGKAGLPPDSELPVPDTEFAGDGLSYHIRTGQHAITLADWNIYMDFAQREFPEKFFDN